MPFNTPDNSKHKSKGKKKHTHKENLKEKQQYTIFSFQPKRKKLPSKKTPAESY